MMLRSSSTPLLGSLLSSYHESPSNHHHTEIISSKQCYSPNPFHHHHNHNHTKKLESLHLINSCQSPISPSIADLSPQGNGIRRAQSEGNLESLLASVVLNEGLDEFESSTLLKKFPRKHHYTVLETIPSFQDPLQLSDDEDEDEDDGWEEKGEKRAQATLNSASFGFGESYGNGNNVMNLPNQVENQRFASKMHMAMGLGLDEFSGLFGGNYGGGSEDKGRGSNGDNNGGDYKAEEYYKRMVEENPGDPLFLRNYAEFLYQTKNDLRGAEEYFSRAILADPTDGEILSMYAKVVWALHRDQDRATGYFERAVQAAPEDSAVLAAHANFLWETEEDDEAECEAPEDHDMVTPRLHEGATVAANA